MTEVKVEYKLEIDLDELSPEARNEMPKVLLIFNNIIKQALKQMDYNQIGRFPKFFNAKDKISINHLNVTAWPGYEVCTKLSTQGVFLNVESCTKFVNQESILDMYKSQLREGYTDKDIFEKYNSSNIDQPRMTVITEHNSKSYQVDGMTSNYNPDNYSFKQRDGSEVSMTEYFFKRYNVKLDPKQPLLFVNYNSGDKVYLPASLCHEASLPKNFT
jgi:hypothetical protein